MISGNKMVTVERLFHTPVKLVWQAITQAGLMKQWYFDVPDFKAEVGCKFQFNGGPPEKTYVHVCEVTEVIAEKKLTYSWRYEGYAGISYVTFLLQQQGEKTLVTLTHTGIDSFPEKITDFAIHNFAKGWNHIINISLHEFLEKQVNK